jgi:hypothetical protein
VEARSGNDWVRARFLPLDWIGIQLRDDGSCGGGIQKSRFTRITKDEKDTFGKLEDIQIALSRLVDDWGDPNAEIRKHLIAPRSVKIGDPIPLRIYLEFNIRSQGGGWHERERDFFLDGKPLFLPKDNGFRLEGGRYMTWGRPSGYVEKATYDVSKHLTKPGIYRIQFGKPGSEHRSNEVVIEVRP